MIKALSWTFSHLDWKMIKTHENSASPGRILDVFTSWLSKRVLKRRFLGSGLSNFSTVPNFGNTLALWQSSFVSKCLKFDVDCRNGTKNWEKLFYFLDNCIWIGSGKFSQSWTRYLSSAVNVLTNTPKTSPITRGDISQINAHENEEKTW